MRNHPGASFLTPALASLVTVLLLQACGPPSADNPLSPAGDGGEPSVVAEAGPEAGDEACASGVLCRAGVGLCTQPRVCTASDPCQGSAGLPGGGKITTSITVPSCQSTAAARGSFNDGAPVTWTDPRTSQNRAACVFRSAGVSATSSYPMIVFLHGSGGSASSIYDNTSLRAKAPTFVLSADGTRKGFVLVADQGRNLHSENSNPDESHHDVYFRDPATPDNNDDVRAIDTLIDNQVAAGGIDPKRIYVMGWSNGGFFAQQYGILRHRTPTKGGARVAAAVIFASADPYAAPSADAPTCQVDSYPSTAMPILVAHRDCDFLVGCDDAQAKKFNLPPGYSVETWLGTLRGPMADNAVHEQIIGIDGSAQTACNDSVTCSAKSGLQEHIDWPDGVADGSGTDWEPMMLGFLRDHPLP